jgi:hypothetical protein
LQLEEKPCGEYVVNTIGVAFVAPLTVTPAGPLAARYTVVCATPKKGSDNKITDSVLIGSI